MQKSKGKVIDGETVRRIARLSRINLSDEELGRYSTQLAAILEYIGQLDEVDSSNTPPTSHPLEGLKNVFRKDVRLESLGKEDALRNAPGRKNDFFSVPKIIG